MEEEEGGIPGREEKTALMIQVRAVSPAPRQRSLLAMLRRRDELGNGENALPWRLGSVGVNLELPGANGGAVFISRRQG